MITELAKFRFEDDQLTLVKLQPGVSLEEVSAKTDAKFVVALQD